MFRDFSFAPASPPSYSAYEADRASMNVSPSSKPSQSNHYLARPPTPPCTIGDLASKLNQQSLRIDTSINRQPSPSAPLTPPSSSDDEQLEPTQSRPTYSRVSASLLRMQRQSSSRLQCSSAHVRDISRLVRMIEAEEQCTVGDDLSRTSSASTASGPIESEADEGVDMDYDMSSRNIEALVGMQPWRANDRRDSCIRVTKPVRMRKRSGDKVEKRRSK